MELFLESKFKMNTSSKQNLLKESFWVFNKPKYFIDKTKSCGSSPQAPFNNFFHLNNVKLLNRLKFLRSFLFLERSGNLSLSYLPFYR